VQGAGDGRPPRVENYKDLIVWQRAKSLAVRCIRLANQEKRVIGSDGVFRQVVAAATSVGANIAEGYGRRGGSEYIRFLEIAYGSACETESWAIIIQESNLGRDPGWQLVQSEALEVQRMLGKIMSRIRERTRSAAAVREPRESYDPWANEDLRPSS